MAITALDAITRIFRWLKKADAASEMRQVVISRYGFSGKYKIAVLVNGVEVKRISDGPAGTELGIIEKLLSSLGE